ncbi:MAG: GNAT family N-acetyltransferase [Pseudomonadota bacterium]
MISLPVLYEVLDRTWPSLRTRRVGPWLIREGAGGGQRVSSATVRESWNEADIPQAEVAMRALGQTPLFMIREGDAALDRFLAARGYRYHDAVTAYACPVAALAECVPGRLDGFTAWPPLEIMRQIWMEGGIDAARIDVMARASDPKTAILDRADDRAAGVGFVSVHGNVAMLHALEVSKDQRRKGVGRNIVKTAARWAREHEAAVFSLVTTSENPLSNALYTSLGMSNVGHYHYRVEEIF